MHFPGEIHRNQHALFAEIRMSQQTYDIVVMFRDKLKRRRLRRDTQPDMKGGNTSREDTHGLPLPRKQPSKAAMNQESSDRQSTYPSKSSVQERFDAVKTGFSQNVKLGSHSKQYRDRRSKLVATEQNHSWDAPARLRASRAELQAQDIIFRIRENERVDPEMFGNVPGEAVPDPISRDMGGRFLVNKDRIEGSDTRDPSKIFQIASRMPKGCHLHLHFNSEIPPEQLFPHARQPNVAKTMFIRSTIPLTNPKAYDDTEIIFNVLPAETEQVDIFSDSYNPKVPKEGDPRTSPWMLWKTFREQFPMGVKCESNIKDLDPAECWAREKMIIAVDRTYNKEQTHNGTWACFNIGTRAFKGLLGYESVYRWYIGEAVRSMIRDGVMYTEMRPMLLDKTIPSDDGLRLLDHHDQMRIICEEVTKIQKGLADKNELDKFPFGVKIIYCTPRSLKPERMQSELEDCVKLKLQFPDLICGFDLVGAEDRPNCIGFYADLLVEFTETCKQHGISIPFLFHAGETLLDTGGSKDPKNSNLYDALLLNAKRIGHGYALLKHPILVQKYKEQNICLELCPISNELLHLCGNAREHPYPQLLAAGLHCTLNADNPSLFRGATNFSSSLSHEFYQVMVGDPRMTVHGWKQLAEWSIEHSRLSFEEIKRAKDIHARAWEQFCDWVVNEFGDYADSLPE